MGQRFTLRPRGSNAEEVCNYIAMRSKSPVPIEQENSRLTPFDRTRIVGGDYIPCCYLSLIEVSSISSAHPRAPTLPNVSDIFPRISFQRPSTIHLPLLRNT